jgi:hypothetical protein
MTWLLALLASVASAGPTAKEAPLIPDWKQSQFVEGDPGIRAVYVVALCARNHHRQAVEALLESSPLATDEARLFAEAVPPGQTDCPTRVETLRIKNLYVMRGALAEAIYNGEKRKPKVASLPFAEAFPPSGQGKPGVVALWVARCAVRRSPPAAHAVLQFNPGAVGERRALLALGPTFVACLPAGERLQITRLAFRALIAEELYHASVSFKESFAHAQG